MTEAKGETGETDAAATFAVFESGGRQHRVVPGETVRLERLPGEPGERVSFERVLLVAVGADVRVGQPVVPGAVVTGELVAQGKAKKIRVIKFKRRKNYLRRKGHRQRFSDVLIQSVILPTDAEPSVAAAAEENANAASIAA